MKRSLVSIAVGLVTLLCSCSDQADSIVGSDNGTTISKKGNIEIVLNSGAKSRGSITVKETPVTHAELILTYPNGKSTSDMWFNTDSTNSILFPYEESGMYTLTVVENGGSNDSTVYDNSFMVKAGSNYTVKVDLGMSIKVVVNGEHVNDTIIDTTLIKAFNGFWKPTHSTPGSYTKIYKADSSIAADFHLEFTDDFVWTGLQFMPNYHFANYKGIEINYKSSDTLFMGLINENQDLVRTYQLPPGVDSTVIYLDDFIIPDWLPDTIDIIDTKILNLSFDVFCDSTVGPKPKNETLEIYNIQPY